MQKFFDTAADSVTRVPLFEATVTVYRKGTAVLASLFSDDGVTSLTNPVVTNDKGFYSFYAPNGKYDLVIAKPGYESVTITDVELHDGVQASDYGLLRSATDNTGALQAAIDTISTRVGIGNSGGDVIEIDSGTHNFAGKININNSFIRLIGKGKQSTFFNFANGSQDCIVIDGVSAPGGNLRDVSIEDIGIFCSGKSAGATIKILNAYRISLKSLYLEQGITLVDIGRATNDILLRDCTLVPSSVNSLHGIWWHCPGDGSTRSDVLTLNNVVIEGQWSDATCMLWEGFCNTLVASHFRVLHANYGLRVINPANSSSYYPSFANVFDFEAEGFMTNAMRIEAGACFKFSDSDINNLTGYSGQGNADTYAVVILPDTGFSYTRSMQFANCRIGLCRSEGIYTNARDIQLSNIVIISSSMSAVGGFPAVRVGSNSKDVQISNLRGEEYGGAGKASYALQIDNGAVGVQVSNIDATYCQTGAVNNLSNSGTVSIMGVQEPGNIGSNFVSYGNSDILLQKNVPGLAYNLSVYNTSASNNSSARVQWSTGISNSYVITELNNAGGVPTFSCASGPAVASVTYTYPIHNFRIGANTAFSIGQPLGDYINDAAAAAGGIPLYGYYRNGNAVQQRLV